MSYCAKEDLLLGGIPLPGYIDPQKQVDDAADEIDSKIGYVYKTPIDLNSSTTTVARPASLLLKRINAHLATGRLILAVASPEENKNLHAYGWNLVKEATAALDAIATGDVVLEGAEASDIVQADPAVSVPLIANVDGESNVEAFYDRLGNPNYRYPWDLGPARRINPDGLVL